MKRKDGHEEEGGTEETNEEYGRGNTVNRGGGRWEVRQVVQDTNESNESVAGYVEAMKGLQDRQEH